MDSIHVGDDFDFPPINTREDIGLSDQELVMLSTKDLNKLLKRKNIPKERQKQLKQERRTLKNRGYAANCRVKRETEEKILERKNEQLKYDIHAKFIEVGKIQKENDELMKIYQDLDEEVEKLKQDQDKFLDINIIKHEKMDENE